MISVSGKIIDQVTGESIPYANVYFSDSGGQILPGHQGSTSDKNGNYSIEGNGAYITASYVGYSKETKPFKRSLDFELVSGVELKEVLVIGNKEKTRRLNENIIAIGILTGVTAIIGYIYFNSRI